MNQAKPGVLVTGAAGRLGAALSSALEQRGWAVHRAARNPERQGYIGVGTIGPDTSWERALDGVEAVVHCAALTWLADGTPEEQEAAFQRANRHGTAALARQAADAGIRRFVLISSATVNGRSSGRDVFRADDPPNPDSAYSRSKRDAEADLFAIAQSVQMDAVAIRPPRIIWPQLSGNLALLAKLVRLGVPLPFGSIDFNRRDNISPDSLIDLAALSLEHPGAAGRVFLASDGTPFSTRELLVRIGKHVGRAPRLLPVPVPIVRSTVRAAPQRLLGRMTRAEMELELLGNLALDISPARKLLGWSPAPSII